MPLPNAKRPQDTLSNWPIYALKAAFASGLTALLASRLGLADVISAAFVAVLCTTPTLINGLKQGFEQLIGSFLGGLFATGTLLLGIPCLSRAYWACPAVAWLPLLQPSISSF
jgi:hypothetical protein